MINTKKTKQGFTLLELMVVIVLVGILASIIFVLLSSAKSKGDDAAVQANLRTVASQVGIFYLDNGNSYGEYSLGACPTVFETGSGNLFSGDKATFDAIAEATKRGDGRNSCFANSADWAVAVGLKTTPNTSWCVDSQGVATQIASTPDLAITNGACGEQSNPPPPPPPPIGFCGDGRLSSDEECDRGINNGPCPKRCSNRCTLNRCLP